MNHDEGNQGPRNAADDFIQHLGAAKAQLGEVNERIEKRVGRNLFLAVATGLGIGGVFLVSLIFFKWAFLAICFAGAIAASVELAMALRTHAVWVPRVGIAVGVSIVVAAPIFFGLAGALIGTVAGAAFVCLWYVTERWILSARSRQGPVSGGLWRDLAGIGGVVLYTGLLPAFTVLLMVQPRGEWWVLGFIIVVVSNDTGAYATGVAWGKHPMAPVVSPKKSWEGFVGGAVIASITGALVSWLMLPHTIVFGVFFGIALVISGTLGDLLESFIKRRLGIKDMSSWLPGHGGVLDRLDSIILSAPVAYAFFVIATL